MDRDTRHDLNNFLSAIVTYADMLRHDLEPESRHYKMATAIHESGMKAIAYIQKEKSSISESADASIAGRYILVVDDQPDMREMIAIVLEAHGCLVDSCASADDLMRVLKLGKIDYDLIVLDQSMPDRTGDGVARDIGIDYPDMPIIMVTGHKKADVLAATRDIAGVRDCVEKTTMMADLPKAISRIMSA
jgi:CheY-like chemotaxis protein